MIILKKTKQISLLDILINFQSIQIPQQDQINIKYKNQFPQIPKSKLNLVSTLISKGKSIVESLAPVRSFFPYKQQLFNQEKISDLKIYYHVISWLSCDDAVKSVNDFPTFIRKIKINQKLIPRQNYIFILKTCVSHFLFLGGQFTPDLVQIVFDELIPAFFDIFINVLDAEIQLNKYEVYQALILCLSNHLKSNHSLFKTFDFSHVLMCIYHYSCKLEETSCELIKTISSYFVIDVLFLFYDDLTILISTNILNFPSKIGEEIKPIKNKVYEFETFQNLLIQIQIDAPDSFPNSFILPKPNEFETQITFETFFDPEEFKIFNKILNLLENCLPAYNERFFDAFCKLVFQSSSQNFWSDIYCSYQYFLLNVNKIVFNKNILETIEMIFEPGISSFNKCAHFDIIRFLRVNSLAIINKHNPTLISHLLNKYERNTFLFADIIGMIHARLFSFDGNALVNEKSLSSIICAISILDTFQNNLREKHMNYSELDPSEINKNDDDDDDIYDKVQQARSTIILFIFALIENNSTKYQCFSSPCLTTGFLSRVFVQSLQQPIISSIKQFLSNFEPSQVIQTIKFLGGLIDICRKNKKYDNLALDLVSCVNDSIGHNPKISIVCDSFLQPVTIFVTERPSTMFLSQTLQLYSQLSLNNDQFQLNLNQAQLLSKAIKQQGSNDETTILLLIGIMARSRSANDKSMFFIQAPMFVLLFFSILDTEEKCHKYLKLFNDICHHSIYNCIQCHKGEFDLFLLEVIKNNNCKFVFRDFEFNFIIPEQDKIEIIIPLLNYIEMFISSPHFVYKYIQTLLTFSDYSFKLMDSLIQALSIFLNQPQVSLMCGYSDDYISVCDVRAEELSKGFTLQMTVQIDTFYSQISSHQPLLFSITDSTHGFTIFVQGQSLIAQINHFVNGKDNALSAPICSDFPSCIWKTFTLTLQTPTGNNPQSKITFYFEGDKEDVFSANFVPFTSNTLNVKIGGLNKKGSPSDVYVSVACFRLFSGAISRHELKELPPMHQAIQRFNRTKESNQALTPLFSWPSKTTNHTKPKIFLNQEGQNQIPKKIIFPRYKSHFYSTILDVCSSENCFRSLIPFFLYINEMPNLFPEIFIEFLRLLITYNANSSFSRLFELIPPILIESCDPKKLTYQIYLKFFALLDNCSELEIINSIINKILFNPELWISCESSQLTRIVTHWCTTLYSAYPHQIPQFTEILTIIRIYFWSEPIELEVIRGTKESKRPRPTDLNIDLIRNNFGRMLLQIVQTSFDIKSAKSFISHCTTCPDSKTVLWMMSLFVDIIKITHTEIKVPQEICEMLYTQLKPRQEERFVITLKVIYILSGNFLYHLNIIMTLLNVLFYTDLLLDKLLEALNEYPLLYPICILVSINLGKYNLMSEALKDLVIPDPVNLLSNDFWALFPFILANYVDKEKIPNLIIFMINVITPDFQFSYLDSLITIFDILNSSQLLQIDYFFKYFMLILAQKVDDSHFDKVFFRCMKISFLHLGYHKHSPLLNNEYVKSPFYDANNSSDDVMIRSKSINNPNFSPAAKRKRSLNKNSQKLWQSLFTLIDDNDDLTKPRERSVSLIRAQSNMVVQSYQTDDEDSDDAIIVTHNGKVQIRTMNDIIALLTQSKCSEDYKFMVFVGDDYNFVDLSFFDLIIQRFLHSDSSPDNEEIKNMKKILNFLFERRDKFINTKEIDLLFFKEISAIQPLIEDFAVFYGKKRFKNISNLKESMIQNIRDNSAKALKSLGKIDSNEVAIAAYEIETFHSEYDLYISETSKEINKMKKLEMTPISPFFNKSKVFKNNILMKRFVFSSNFLQCRFKKAKEFHFKKLQSKLNYQVGPNTVYSCFCNKVQIGEEFISVFEINKNSICVHSEQKQQTIKFESIKRLLKRNRFDHHSSIEIFSFDGHSILLDFYPTTSNQILQIIFHHIPSLNSQNRVVSEYFNSTNIVDSWKNGFVSNFKYLMHLNFYSGRSFNDETLYPIMPWIINKVSDYKLPKSSMNSAPSFSSHSDQNLFFASGSDSDSIPKINNMSNDLADSCLRDLSRPIAEIAGNGNPVELSPLSPAAVGYYLNEVQPFKSLFDKYDKENFPFKNKFSTLTKTWEEAVANSMCFELTPEFFFTPEYFERIYNKENNSKESINNENKSTNENSSNNENKSINENNSSNNEFTNNKDSSNSNGSIEVNDDSLLSADEFVYRHRRILESEEVSLHLHQWIDLMWGVNCQNQWNIISNINKEFISNEEIDCIKENGHKPTQFFTKPHPARTAKFDFKYKKPIDYPLQSLESYEFGRVLLVFSVPSSHLLLITSKWKLVQYSPMYEMPSESVVILNENLKDINSLSSANGKVYCGNITINGIPINYDPKEKSVNPMNEFAETVNFIPIPKGFIMHNLHVISIYKDDNCLWGTLRDPITLIFNLGAIKKIVFDEDILACFNENCQMVLWDIRKVDKDPKKANKFATYTIMDDKISSFNAICLSRGFKQIVYGTIDGLIKGISLEGDFIFSHQIEENPLKILMTKSAGFIVVMTFSFLYLISMNGRRIRKIAKKVDFVYWTTFSSLSDFDFIAAADAKGQVYLFEAFYLNIRYPVFNCKCDVMNISYSNADQHLTIVTGDNHVFIVPTALPYV